MKEKKRKTPHKHPCMYESQDNTLQYIGLCSDIFLILNQFILLTLHLLHIFSCKLTLCKQFCLFLCLDIDGEWAVSCSCLSVVCTVSWHHMTHMHSWLLCSCKDSASYRTSIREVNTLSGYHSLPLLLTVMISVSLLGRQKMFSGEKVVKAESRKPLTNGRDKWLF